MVALIGLVAAALACNTLVPGAASATPPTATATPVEQAATPSPSAIPPATGAATATATGRPTETATGSPSDTPSPTSTITPTAFNFIAYVTDGQVLVTDVTGGVKGGTTQYTQAGVNDGVYDFVWSPSGETIAFVSAAGGGDPHLYVVFVVGAATPVDLGPGGQPNWSPDSTTLAYVREGNIWLTTVDTPQPQALTTQTNWAWGRPVFAPAGDALVVSGVPFDQMGAQGNTEFTFSTLPLDGSGTLTPLPGMTTPVDGRLPYDLRFSPDGQKLAFFTSWHLSACASAGSYYVLNADGSGLTALNSPAMEALLVPNTDITLLGLGYAWKPTGDGLLITSLVVDCTDFAGTQLGAQVSTVDFASQEALVAVGYFTAPSYSRDGAVIGVARQTDNAGPGEVVLYAPDGTEVLDVGPGQQPAFQP